MGLDTPIVNQNKEKLIEYLNHLCYLYKIDDDKDNKISHILDKICELDINDFDKASFIFYISDFYTRDKLEYVTDIMDNYAYKYYKTVYDIGMLDNFFKNYLQEVKYIVNNSIGKDNLLSYIYRFYHMSNAAFLYNRIDGIKIDGINYNLIRMIVRIEIARIDIIPTTDIIQMLLLITDKTHMMSNFYE